MKRLALIVLFVAGCKPSESKPAPAPAVDDTPAAPTQHTARATPPSLPPSEQEGSNRPSLPEDRPWRHHNHRMGSDDYASMTPEEREVARRARVESMRSKFDTNGDGKLSYDELKNAPGRMHFDNPEELDTNHDGDISVDELEAGMQARRDAWRAQRQADQNPAPGGGSATTP